MDRNQSGAGFDHEAGRSNNMVAAEREGMITVGRWAKHYGVSARAAVEVMQPAEAHHTGTGRRGKSRLTPVIAADAVPTAAQLTAMLTWDRGDRPTVQGWYIAWEKQTGRYGRRFNVPILAIFRGDIAEAPRKLRALDDREYAHAISLAGRTLRAYAVAYDDLI